MRYRSTTETANKQEAKKVGARERSRVLEGRHGIRRQPDITFSTFAKTYLTDDAELHKRSVDSLEISGHSSTRMLGRYTHPTAERKIGALESFGSMGRKWAEREDRGWKKAGGRQEARTPDLRVANAALSQLS